MTSTTASNSTGKKRTIKQKLDDSVLKKARLALGLPPESLDNDEKGEDQEPSLKWRKPRHNTVEGQIYMKNKEKRKKLEDEARDQSSSSVQPEARKKDSKSKKKRNNKKKKKGNNNAGDGESNEHSRNPDNANKHQQEALSYLQLWASNRDHWKFEKLKQLWLLKNCLDEKLIDEKRFELLLEYAASIKGAVRKTKLLEMQDIIGKFENSSEASGNNQTQEESNPITRVMYDRARQMVQMFADD